MFASEIAARRLHTVSGANAARCALALTFLFAGCPAPDPMPGTDAGGDAGGAVDAPAPGLDAPPGDDAGGGDCTEPDGDGDGVDSIECGGLDCDDTDPQRAPGRTELCDVADHDEDCDPTTYGYRDTDMDDAPDAACCNDGGGTPFCGDDCDDMRAGVHPDATETCDGRDNDCDTYVDEGVLETFYVDVDGDNHGASGGDSMDLCAPSGNYRATIADDCDDAAVGVYPGAAELCDGIDTDCTLPVDPPTCTCVAGEMTDCGYDATTCAVVRASCGVGGVFACPPSGLRSGMEPELCNGVDDNCVGGPGGAPAIDEGCPCAPVGATRACSTGGRLGVCAVGSETCMPTGYVGCAMPSAEICGGDQDCDGTTDEGAHLSRTRLPDPCAGSYGTSTCARAIAEACLGRAGMDGECSGRSGFGPMGLNGGLLSVMCTDLTPTVTGLTGGGIFDSCLSSDTLPSTCRYGAHLYCRDRDYASGYAWITGTGAAARISVQCLDDTQAQVFLRATSELVSFEPTCNANPYNQPSCPQAAHEWCVDRGFATGLPPIPDRVGTVTLVCVRDF